MRQLTAALRRAIAKAVDACGGQTEVAKMTGVSQQNISKYVSGGVAKIGEPAFSSLYPLIRSYLPEDFPPPHASSNARILSADELRAGRRVPLLSMAQAAQMFNPAFPPPESNLGEEVSFMRAEDGDFAISVSGRSMEPWYPSGTRLLVKRSRKPETGNRVAAMLADRAEPVFKIFIDLGASVALLSINEKDGIAPIELDKMDKGETWYWIYPIGESVRDEFALDECMRRHGVHHFWEDRMKEARTRAAQVSGTLPQAQARTRSGISLDMENE